MTERRVERTTLLPCLPELAWNAVMSPDIAPRIDPAVKSWTPDREPIDVGTRFTIRGRLGILPIRGVSETVRWDPPHVGAFLSVQGSRPMRVLATHSFEPSETGTRYTWCMDFVGPLPMVAFAARLFAHAIQRQQTTLSAYLDQSR
jgi:Polyketide cyclase / dehydrase and lipid transport